LLARSGVAVDQVAVGVTARAAPGGQPSSAGVINREIPIQTTAYRRWGSFKILVNHRARLFSWIFRVSR